MINRAAGADVIPRRFEHDTGVIVYSPLHSGLLTGHFSAERVAALPIRPRAGRLHRISRTGFGVDLELAAGVVATVEELGTSAAAVAVAWVLSWDGVSGAIVGARSPVQLDAWIGAAELHLRPDVLDRLGLGHRIRVRPWPRRPT